MKLDRFKNMNENREMYFISDRKITEEEQKYTIIEKLSQNWSEKLKQDYLVPRSLYRYSLDELKEIEKFYLKSESDTNNKPKIFTETKYDLPEEEDLVDINNFDLSADDIINGFGYTIIGRGIKDDKKIKMIIDSIKLLCEKYPQNEIYKEALKKYKEKNNINESVRIVEPKNNELENALAELKEQHGSNDAVEDIRLEGNEIVFDVKCETDIQGTTEYNDFTLRYNKLCEIPSINEEIEYEEIEEDVIMEQLNYWKIKL